MGSEGAAPEVGIVVATRNRAALLPQALQSLQAARATAAIPSEVIVIDNGSSDGTPRILAQWAAAAGYRTLVVEQPGKARALNAGLTLVSAPLVVFTDDDVDIPPTWLRAVVTFFATHPEYAAAMGRVLASPDARAPDVLAKIKRYPGVIPIYDLGDRVRDVRDMYGCNMAVRRTVLAQVGPFDDRLGPGASGLTEDVDLSDRIRRAGFRIGYMPDAVVCHHVDTSRLTPGYHRQFVLRSARGEFLMHPEHSYWRSIARLLEAVSLLVCWSALGQSQRRHRAWRRVLHHAALLRCRWEAAHERRRLSPAPPPRREHTL